MAYGQVLHNLAIAHLEGDGSPETALNCIQRLQDASECQTPMLRLLSLKALWKLNSQQVWQIRLCL